MLKDKKILITGGAGFIGSNLCSYFVENNKVTCLDNFLTGKRENIESLKEHPNFTFIEGDIRDFDTCLRLTEGQDVVLHQAALGSVPRSIEQPLRTNEHNITGFLNMLEAAVKSNVKRFVFAASSSTYGDHPGLPKVEDKIGKPLSPYAVTKYVNELYAKVFSDLYGIETVGLRYFNVFGRNQDPNGAYAAVIPKFIKGIIEGKEIVVNGDGEQTRDFTYIDNVIQANELAASTNNVEALNTVFNIAYGGTITLNDLLNEMREAIESKKIESAEFNIKYGPERRGDIKHSFASIDKAKKLLSYSPAVSLKEGIRLYLNDLLASNPEILT